MFPVPSFEVVLLLTVSLDAALTGEAATGGNPELMIRCYSGGEELEGVWEVDGIFLSMLDAGDSFLNDPFDVYEKGAKLMGCT